MTRRAILIGCASDSDDNPQLVTGVQRDIDLYESFLASFLGGEWYKEEITTFRSPSRGELLNHLSTIRDDYTFLTFSGHGYINPVDGRTCVNLRGTDVASDYELVTKSPRKTIIIDACRSYNFEQAPSPPPLQKLAEALSLETTRAIFEKALSRCEMGTIILYSTGSDQPAGSNENGGFFTQCILEGAARWHDTTSEPVLDIFKAFGYAKSLLHNYPGPQKPQINTGRRHRMYPFAVKQVNIKSDLSLKDLVDEIIAG